MPVRRGLGMPPRTESASCVKAPGGDWKKPAGAPRIIGRRIAANAVPLHGPRNSDSLGCEDGRAVVADEVPPR